MRILRSLLWKEWRDRRGLIGISCILGTLLIGLIRYVFLREFQGVDDLVSRQVVPGVAVVPLAALAADHFGGDCNPGLGDAQARLGAGAPVMWLAKVLHLVGSSVLVVLWLMGAELVRAEFLAGDPAVLLSNWTSVLMVPCWIGLSGLLLIVSALAVLLRRGLVAVLLGLVAAAGWFLLLIQHWGGSLPVNLRFGEYPGTVYLPWVLLWSLLGCALVLGSLACYRPGRLSAARRCAGFAALLLVVFGAPALAVHARVQDLWRGRYGDPACGMASVSPDGRSVLVATRTSGSDWFGDHEGNPKVWVLDFASGEVLHVFGGAEIPFPNAEGSGTWSAASELCIFDRQAAEGLPFTVLEPRSGDSSTHDRQPAGWRQWYPDLYRGSRQHRVTLAGQEFALPQGCIAPSHGHRFGTIYWTGESNQLRRTDLVRDETREYSVELTSRHVGGLESPDGRWFWLNAPDDCILNLDSGEIVAEVPDGWYFRAWSEAGPDSAGGDLLVLAPRSDSESCERQVLTANGEWHSIQLEHAGRVASMTAHGFIVFRGGQLFVVDPDGRDVRRLYPGEVEP